MTMSRTAAAWPAPRARAAGGAGSLLYTTREEETALARGFAQGSLETRNQMVVANLGFVTKVAREYINMGLPMEDLLSEGSIGLIRAASRYDHRRGARFITYASWWVRKSILTALADQAWTIRIPAYQRKKGDVCASGAVYGYRAVSLDAAPGEAGGRSIKDTLADGASEDPERAVIRREDLARLARCLPDLSERERSALVRRYGLEGGRGATLKEVAAELGLSRERVRQIEHSARSRLRAWMDAGRVRLRGTGGRERRPGFPATSRLAAGQESEDLRLEVEHETARGGSRDSLEVDPAQPSLAELDGEQRRRRQQELSGQAREVRLVPDQHDRLEPAGRNQAGQRRGGRPAGRERRAHTDGRLRTQRRGDYPRGLARPQERAGEHQVERETERA